MPGMPESAGLRERPIGPMPVWIGKAHVREMPGALLSKSAARTGAGCHALRRTMLWEHPFLSLRHWLDGLRSAPQKAA